MGKKQIKDEDKPYVENYPPLRDWLRDHNARCNWQIPIGNPREPTGYVESYALQGAKGDLIVVVHARKMGWNIYTAERTGEVVKTFADAEQRIGLSPKPGESGAEPGTASSPERKVVDDGTEIRGEVPVSVEHYVPSSGHARIHMRSTCAEFKNEEFSGVLYLPNGGASPVIEVKKTGDESSDVITFDARSMILEAIKLYKREHP